jgi:hypothetical protein
MPAWNWRSLMKINMLVLIVFLAVSSLTGCVGQQAFTNMARKGDTVTLALGGSPRHELSSFVNKNNVQVKITDSSAATYDANLRYLLKVYSDPANRYNYNSTFDNSAGNWFSQYYIKPNQGLWVAVVDLTYPGTSTPLPLAEGPAQFQVITPDLTDSIVTAGLPNSDGHLSQIPIQILAGTGSPHPFNDYGDPVDLQPLPQMLIHFDNSAITPDFPYAYTAIGAIEFQLSYDKTYFSDNKFPPMILGNINDPRINVMTHIDKSLGVYKVTVFAPFNGILANNDPNNLYLNPEIEEMKIFVVWDPAYLGQAIDATNFNQVFTISGYKIVDLNGNPLVDGGGAPLITMQKELLQ